MAEQGGQRRGRGAVTDDGLGLSARVKGTKRHRTGEGRLLFRTGRAGFGRSAGAEATEREEEAWALSRSAGDPAAPRTKGVSLRKPGE